LRITVESIVSERDFGMIFAGRAAEGGRLRVRATFDRLLGVPSVGDIWEIAGEPVTTPYGPQIVATSGRRLLPSGRMIVRFVAENVPGIGPTRADRLWEAFGANLAEILADEGAVDEVAAALAPDRPVLAKRLAIMTIAAWRAASGEAALVAWLAQQGVDDLKIARRLYRVLGEAAVERLAANPYAMVPLLPWSRLDALGSRLLREDGSDPSTDPKRITGAADETVKQMLWRGDTMAEASAVTAGMLKLLGPGPDEKTCLRIALANGAVVPDGGALRAPGAAALEDELTTRLRALVGRDVRWSALPPSRWSDEISQVEDARWPFSADQRAAVAFIMNRYFACLAGGAGTGKTTICKAACDLHVRSGGDVVLTALAGKAALKLSRSTGRLARTLARMLAELAERDDIEAELDGTDPEDPAGAKQRARLDVLCRLTSRTLLVVDESSMVDPVTVLAIVRRLPTGGRLLMVGDEAQLPPVKFGLAYHRFVADPAITVTLRQVHRQAAATGIPLAAQAVREGRMPDLPAFAGKTDGITLLAVGAADLAETVNRLCLEFGDEGLVVTSTLGGAAGVRAINERRHAAIAGAVTKGFYGRSFAVGEPVIYGRNDYTLGLFNGLLGRVVGVRPDERALVILFDGDGEPKRLAGEQLLDLDHAYAVTCHKCQGSSAPRVVVPVYPSRLLDRSWVYTAITRAERQVVLVGDAEVLAAAIARPPSAQLRRSGLRWP
jgi:exodeoxyribonuclease V alpha subunit